MTTYRLVNDKETGAPVCVKRSDGWVIPMNPDNTDYQAYLQWLSEGNTPEPAEEQQ